MFSRTVMMLHTKSQYVQLRIEDLSEPVPLKKTSFLTFVFKNNVKMKMLNPKVLNVGD